MPPSGVAFTPDPAVGPSEVEALDWDSREPGIETRVGESSTFEQVGTDLLDPGCRGGWSSDPLVEQLAHVPATDPAFPRHVTEYFGHFINCYQLRGERLVESSGHEPQPHHGSQVDERSGWRRHGHSLHDEPMVFEQVDRSMNRNVGETRGLSGRERSRPPFPWQLPECHGFPQLTRGRQLRQEEFRRRR